MTAFLSITHSSRAAEYSYKTLKADWMQNWDVSEPKQPNGKVKFDDLRIQKSEVKLVEYIKKNPKFEGLKKIVIIGDTGCRIKESKKKAQYQDCRDPKQWPYPEIAQSVLSEDPDLIVHLGDYHYREKCSPGKPCEGMSPEVGYQWLPWKLDFFEPSKSLLKAAPWLMVRGNHEDCNRAFQGFKLLLKSDDWNSECDDHEGAQVVQIGKLTLVNLDSSGIPDSLDSSIELKNKWLKRLEKVNEKLEKAKSEYVWLFTHKPIYGLVANGNGYSPLNMNLRKFLDESKLSKKIDLIFSGHVHLSQLVQASGGPLQIVVGNSGTSLDKAPEPPTEENLQNLGIKKANVLRHFGYATLERKSENETKIQFHNTKGEMIFECSLEENAQDCFKK